MHDYIIVHDGVNATIEHELGCDRGLLDPAERSEAIEAYIMS